MRRIAGAQRDVRAILLLLVCAVCVSAAEQGPAQPKTDPAGPSTGQRRVVRGGSWQSDGGGCRSGSRWYSSPGRSWDDIGFRVVCALDARPKGHNGPAPRPIAEP